MHRALQLAYECTFERINCKACLMEGKSLCLKHHKWDASLYKTLQHFDGYTPHIFLDYGDYVSKLCTDSLLLNRFNTQLERVVPSATRAHTPDFYSALNMIRTPIRTFCGLATSDPSFHQWATTKTETNWYKATH